MSVKSVKSINKAHSCKMHKIESHWEKITNYNVNRTLGFVLICIIMFCNNKNTVCIEYVALVFNNSSTILYWSLSVLVDHSDFIHSLVHPLVEQHTHPVTTSP